MSEERITTTEPGRDTGPTTTHTTIIREDEKSRGGSGWLIAIVLVIAVLAGIYIFSQTSASEAVKDNAIADAAGQVGDAAGEVGEAAGQVGEAIENTANNAVE